MPGVKYVLIEPSGLYFKKGACFAHWDFTDKIEEAETFDVKEEAEKLKEAITMGVNQTYWDYSDIVPTPSIQEVPASKTSQTPQTPQTSQKEVK